MLIIWDFNGTLLDDVKLCFDILNDMLTARQKPRISMERYLNIFGFPIEEYYIKAGFDFRDETFLSASEDFIKRYQKASLNLYIFEDVLEKLAEFKQKGYKQVLLSASKESNLIEQVNHYNIGSYFDIIRGTSDILAKGKLEHAKDIVNQFHIDVSHVYFIGDTLHDLVIAQAMNANAILISRGHQSHARLKDAHDQVFSSVKEVRL